MREEITVMSGTFGYIGEQVEPLDFRNITIEFTNGLEFLVEGHFKLQVNEEEESITLIKQSASPLPMAPELQTMHDVYQVFISNRSVTLQLKKCRTEITLHIQQ